MIIDPVISGLAARLREAERRADEEHRAWCKAIELAGRSQDDVKRLRAALERIHAWTVDTPYGFVAADLAAAALDREGEDDG